MLRITSYRELCKLLKTRSIDKVLLFIGNGPKKQYKDVDDVNKNLNLVLSSHLKEPVCVAYGGDTYNGREQPDLGTVVKEFKNKHHNVTLLSVQSWQEVDSHVDIVYDYPHVEYKTHPSLSWGGIFNSIPTGATSIYLSNEWINSECFKLTVIDISAVGYVGKQEIKYANDNNVEIIKVNAAPRFSD